MITQELADSLAGLLFPRKLWTLANCPDVESIKWGKLGTTVLINSVLVEKECFKPNVFNVQSNQHVLRQMSYYNFQKIDRKCKIWEFKHEHFQAGREDLLHLVKRQPQGVPKKYIEDVERRYSSRLQRQSMKGDRPNYARMEKGDSGGESEVDAHQLFERRHSTRSATRKRPYHRRSTEIVRSGERTRGTPTRGRGSRRGGRGRKRTMDRFDENSQDESIPRGEEEGKDEQRRRSGEELEYIVPNCENWPYGSLQNGMDGLTIAEDAARVPDGAAENNVQFGMNTKEDDKSHLKYVVESTERAMMDAKRQQEAMLANEWSGQPYYGARTNQNFLWSSPDMLHVDGRYPTMSDGNASEMYSNGNNYPFFNPQSNFSGNLCIPYGGVNFSRSMLNYNLPLPVPIQYSSAGNVLSEKMHSYTESLPSFSEFSGGSNIPRAIDAFDDLFRSQSNQTQDHQREQQKSDGSSEVPVDVVTLDHNYNTIKGSFDTLEAEFNPLDKTIQSAMQHHDSLLAQLIDEQNADRILMNELRSRSSGESLEQPAPIQMNSPRTSDSILGQQNSPTPELTRKSSEDLTNSSGSLDYPTGATISWTGDLIPHSELTSISESKVPNGWDAPSPSKENESDATTVAYFLLDSTKYKKYSFTVTETGDILIRDCVEDFNYWRTNKDVNPQTLITSPCLQREQ